MSDRLHRLTVRGRIGLGACFLVVVVQMLLNGLGMADYHFEMGPNSDKTMGDRGVPGS